MWKVLVASKSQLLLFCVSSIIVEYVSLQAYLPSVAIHMTLFINSAHPCHEHGRSTCPSLATCCEIPCSYERNRAL